MSTFRAAQIVEPAPAPLQTKQLPIPTPEKDQVLVKVTAGGVCHTDLHEWYAGYDLGSKAKVKALHPGFHYPVTPGHEVSGVVEKVGDGVQDLGVNEHVVVYAWIGCGQADCDRCSTGRENFCERERREIGFYYDGGYGEYVLVPHYKYCVKFDPQKLDPEKACVLGCSALTTFTAIKTAYLRLKEMDVKKATIALIGIGGLGVMALQLCHNYLKPKLEQLKIVCLDITESKLELAKEHGADECVLVSESYDSEAVKKKCIHPTGPDIVIDLVNNPKTAVIGIDLLRKGGTLLEVGLYGGSIDLQLPSLILKIFSIQGIYVGSLPDLRELVKLAEEGAVHAVIDRKYDIDEATQALKDLEAGKIKGRCLIVSQK